MLALLTTAASAYVLPTLHHAAPSAAARAVAPVMAKGNDAVSFPSTLDGSEVRVGIIRARWHEDTIDSLVSGAKSALLETGVKEENIFITDVPGSFELPLATRLLALSGTVDVIIPMGVLIKGDTYHFEVIADTVTSGLMNVGLQTTIPVIFGVLTVNTEEQAKDRSTGSNNHGTQWGKAAVEMAQLRAAALGKKRKNFLGFGEVSDEDKSNSSLDKSKIGF
jgi:6,7-dimethyl-8-ribityllumazine synthase